MYIYRFVDENDRVIYVGKTKQSLRARFYSHNHLPDECYQKVKYIEYVDCITESDMSMKEIYHINKQHSEGNAEYNTADVSESPQSFDINDNWLRYMGSLPEAFSNSVNYIEKYEDKREEIITASDGRKMHLVQNSITGVEKYVFPFTVKELSEIFLYFQMQLLDSRNTFREYANFKNILIVAIGISTPLKPNEILDLRYCDVFDEDDEVRGYRIVRDNITYDFPYPFPVVILLNLFKSEYGFNFSSNKEKYIFVGNKGAKLHYTSINKSILLACNEFDFNQRHSCESMRKTFFRYIFDNSENTYEAIECIEFMSSVYRNTPGRLLKYIDVIPHNEEFNPVSYMKGKYIIDKIDFDWNITFKFENKWAW